MSNVWEPEMGVVYPVALWVLGLSSRRVHLRTEAGLSWVYLKWLGIK